ncbi:hypothetical protein JQ543_21215 [Bradyrhizobium diazoefficiens]|nr:hypothetical protein [Bradyrhizobium diazoefficiens]MBR0850280.1 hypothetical protein [Bradyrhizobium diazoefficiens]
MSNEQESKRDGTVPVDRRSVLIGTASVVAASTFPTAVAADVCLPPTCAALATLQQNILGAVYADPTYLDTFNKNWYSAANVKKLQAWLQRRYKTSAEMTWGDYQMDIEPNPDHWGCTPEKGLIAYNNWKAFAGEARADLEKQPAKFSSPENGVDPFDSTKVAENLIHHLDRVVRTALYDQGVPVTICVGKRKHRHHGLKTKWETKANPGHPAELTGLTIMIDCPEGGWKGYSTWSTKSPNDQITKMEANWEVPSDPQNSGKQIIFIFNGLESVSKLNAPGGILQPVLQWNKDHWSARCWYVTAEFNANDYPTVPKDDQERLTLGADHRCYTKAIPAFTGDSVKGSITGGKDPSSGKFNYNCSISVTSKKNGDTKTVQLAMPDIPELTYAVCAVESYEIANRATDYPSGPIKMSNIHLELDPSSHSPDPIVWNPNPAVGHDFITKTSDDAGHTVEFTLRPSNVSY